MTGPANRRGALRPEPLELVLASDDRNFLRLAGAVLGNEGYTTFRCPVGARRIERLVRLHSPDVLVLDAQEDALVVAEVCSMLLRLGRPVALVLVCEHEREMPDLPVVARWGSPDTLLQAVARAAAGPVQAQAQTRASRSPGLRLVDA